MAFGKYQSLIKQIGSISTLYAAVAWVSIQISETVFPALGIPTWSLSLVIILFVIGFPITLIVILRSSTNVNKVKYSFYSKNSISQILERRLADVNVKDVTLISYTNEVEAGIINKYKVLGLKRINVFKRSIVVEIHEQQYANLSRICKGKNLKPWLKHLKLINTTKELLNNIRDIPSVELNHFFYESPPHWRAYLFDEKEAIISYYEFSESKSGSNYTGMGEVDRLWIDNSSDIGEYLIKQLTNTLGVLRSQSRSWEEELKLLFHPTFIYGTKPIVTNLKAVIFDLDGVLYESMWQYVIAWSAAFKTCGINIPENEVYLNEGRSGEETISILFEKYGKRVPTQEEIDGIKEIRNNELRELHKPKVYFGAIDLIKKIKAQGYKVIIVTGSKNADLINKINEDFDRLISHEDIFWGKDFTFGKPHPEPFWNALHRNRLRSCEAFVIENAPLGIQSANSAGLLTIAINSGPLDDVILKESGAAVVYKNIQQLSSDWDQIISTLDLKLESSITLKEH